MLTNILFLLASAHAVVIAGNPDLGVTVTVAGETVDSALATLDRVTLVGCDGSTTTVAVDAQVDLASSWDVPVPEGDWCDVELAWSSPLVIQGSNAQGDWTFVADPGTSVVDVDPGDGSATLTPAQLVQGVVIAGNPDLGLVLE